MFGMGWQEILLILVVAVLVIGPEQLPQVARTLGKLIAQFRRVTNDLRDTVNREFQDNESLKDFKEFQHSIDSEVRGLGYTAKEFVDHEVAKGEAELAQLDADVRANGGDPGPLTDPALGGAANWTPSLGDFPADEAALQDATAQNATAPDATTPDVTTAADSAAEGAEEAPAAPDAAEEARGADASGDAAAAPASGEPAAAAPASGEPADGEQPVERSSTRRETA
jgi:Tat protein translocase TatB subunit